MRARHLNMGLLSSGALCTAVGVAPVDALPNWAQALFGIAGAICLLLTGTKIVDEIEPASERAKRPHGTGLGLIVLGLFLAGCGGTQHVEVMPPHFEGVAAARVVVPVVVYGVVAYADVVCEVTDDAPVPVCGVCLDVGGIEVCRCFRGAERIDCPALPERPDLVSDDTPPHVHGAGCGCAEAT